MRWRLFFSIFPIIAININPTISDPKKFAIALPDPLEFFEISSIEPQAATFFSELARGDM